MARKIEEKEDRMKVFYHADLDGECSAAIVYLWYKGSGEYISINYGEESKFEFVKNNEKILIFCDFSFFTKIISSFSNNKESR